MAPDSSPSPSATEVLLSTLDEGAIIRAVDGSIIFCNQAAEEILGLTVDQMNGRTSRDPGWQALREDGTDWPEDDHPIRYAIADGISTAGAVMNLRHGNGRRLWISINARPFLVDGEIGGGVATFRDITAERFAADQATANEQQLLDALHGSGLAVATSDRNGNLLSANPHFAEMVGRRNDQLLGMHFTEFSGPDAFDDQLEAVERIRFGESDQFQLLKSYARPDGTLRYALMNLLGLRDSEGELVRHVSLVHDVTDQLVTQAALTVEARTDPLTGGLNRRGVLASLDAALNSDEGHPLLVAFVDLDGFKRINDEFGHEAGDGALREIVAAMRSAVRKSDTVGRLGGDEFVVIFHEAPMSSAGSLRNTLVEAIESVSAPDGQPLTGSIGIVAPDEGDTGAETLRRADAAMYSLKRTGHSRQNTQ